MHLKRARFGKEIVAEFLPPKKSSNKVLVFCNGLPTVPSNARQVKYFSDRGYWTFHLRYKGTWESGGRFLDHSPEEDVWELIDALPNGFTSIWDGEEFSVTPSEVVVFGSSFGGTTALMASRSEKVDKVVALSPVIDWTRDAEEPMGWLKKVIEQGYGQTYQFSDSDWERLAKGEFFQPAAVTEEFTPKKIFLAHAQDDTVVPMAPAQAFVQTVPCKHVFLKNGGHSLGGVFRRFPRSLSLWKFLKG